MQISFAAIQLIANLADSIATPQGQPLKAKSLSCPGKKNTPILLRADDSH
jgi:hypothetical protein